MLPIIKPMPTNRDILAPDGLEVRVLAIGQRGSLAHFCLPAGQTGKAVRHKTIEETWHITGGSGQIWFSTEDLETIASLETGDSLIIPPATSFQLHNSNTAALDIIATTIPPWPGDDEAELVKGHWAATL